MEPIGINTRQSISFMFRTEWMLDKLSTSSRECIFLSQSLKQRSCPRRGAMEWTYTWETVVKEVHLRQTRGLTAERSYAFWRVELTWLRLPPQGCFQSPRLLLSS